MDNKVTVCGICGDAGQDRDGLSICCKCSNGAEHIYCMRSEQDSDVLHKDLSSKNFNGKAKSTKDVTSQLQISCDSLEKAKVPHAYGDKRHGKRRASETRTTFPKTSKPKNQSLPNKKPPLKKLEKRIVVLALPVYSVEQFSSGKKTKYILPKLVLKDTNSAETETDKEKCVYELRHPAETETDKGKCVSELCDPAETETGKGKCVSELCDPATLLPASESGVTVGKSKGKTISRDENFFSGSNGFELDAAQSCGQLDCRSQPNSEAAVAIKLDKPLTSLAKDVFIPMPDCIWQGKFQIHRSDCTASTRDGIQAHLSCHAAQKFSELVGRLPDDIVLEELPRMRMWPTQFMESEATEKSIALYFFAKDNDSYGTYNGLIECMTTKNDLGLKGNMNGFELLIFPSNVLPEKSHFWNSFTFLWGVFKGKKISNSAKTPLSNSAKQENGNTSSSQALDLTVCPEVLQKENKDVVRIRKFDLNAYPEDEDDE